jgi:hypothetical protein
MMRRELNDEERQKLKETVERHMKALGIEICCDKHVSDFDPPA